MKKTFEEKFKAISAKGHGIGNKMLKHPVSSILSLCVLGICAATLITYSQTGDTPAAIEALALPADNVEITDIRGRTITVTVLGRDAKGITVRMADGQEHQLPWNRLSQATIDMLDGKATQEIQREPVVLTEQIVLMELPAEIRLTNTRNIRRIATAIIREEPDRKILVRQEDGSEAIWSLEDLSPRAIKTLRGQSPPHKPSFRSPNGGDIYLPGFYQLYSGERLELVLAKSDGGVVILKDGQEITVPLGELNYISESTFGTKTPRVVGAERKKIRDAKWNAEYLLTTNKNPIANEFRRMSAKQAAEFLKNPPGKDAEKFLNAKRLMLDQIMKIRTNNSEAKNAHFAEHFLTVIDVLDKMDLENIPENETVSLRPEFEKYRVNPMNLSFNEYGCQFQASYKLMNFWLSRKDLPKVSINQFWDIGQKTATMSRMRAGGIAIQTAELGTIFNALIGQQPKRMNLTPGNRALSYELVKHMLRNGRPVMLEVPSTIAYKHIVAIVGFETKEGATRFEVLDRNYYWEPRLTLDWENWAVWYD